MPKNLSSAVSAEIGAQEKRPVSLFELGLSGTTLYYAAHNTNITFQATTYTAKTITYGAITQSAEGQIERVNLNFDNTVRDMSSYLSNNDIRDKTLIIKRIYLGATSGTTDYIEVFRGHMEEPENIGRNWMPINATAGRPLGKRALLKKYTRPCQHIFGDVQSCNANGTVDLTTASYTSSPSIYSGNTNYVFVERSGGATGTTDYWKFGSVQIGNSGTTYNRIVETSSSYTGSDLVTNGGFDADSDWTKGDGWSIAAGVATCDGTQGGDTDLTQENILTVGKTYEIIFTITAYTQGSLAVYAGTEVGDTAYQTAGGPYTQIITCAGNGNLIFRGTNFLGNEWAGSIDNVSAKETGTKILWNVELPNNYVAASTWQFTVKKGCCKNWDCCSGVSVYGPTSGNTLNFGGFIHIGKEREQGGW